MTQERDFIGDFMKHFRVSAEKADLARMILWLLNVETAPLRKELKDKEDAMLGSLVETEGDPGRGRLYLKYQEEAQAIILKWLDTVWGQATREAEQETKELKKETAATGEGGLLD